MRPEVATEGLFARVPFEQLLIKCLDHQYTGRLYVEPELGPATELEMAEGVVIRAAPADDYARLGEVLADAGVITKEERRALGGQQSVGVAAVAAGLIDETTHQQALALQLLKRQVRIFGFPQDTAFRVLVGPAELFDELPGEPARLDPLRVLWAGLSKYGHLSSQYAPTLERIGEFPFRIRQGAQISRFGFADDALLIAELLQRRILSLPELSATGTAPEPVCRRIVYVLAITRYLDFSLDPEPLAVADPPSVEPEPADDSDQPPSSDRAEPPLRARVARIKLRRIAVRQSAAPDEPGTGEQSPTPTCCDRESGLTLSGTPDEAAVARKRQQVLELAARIGELSPWELLGLSPEAIAGLDERRISELVSLAYESCSQRWHPEICPDVLSDLIPQAEVIYRAITEAYMKLTDPEARRRCLPGNDAASPKS